MPAASATRTRDLSLPLFGAALLALVANDWWLKGSGLLPGAVTGKLSDFAGLAVAPVVVTALFASLGADRGRAAALSSAAVGCLFGALQLSPAFARGFDEIASSLCRKAALSCVGRTVSDPTDLMALPALLLGYRLARRIRFDAALGERVLLSAAALACCATTVKYRPARAFNLETHPVGEAIYPFDGGALEVWAGRAGPKATEVGLVVHALDADVRLNLNEIGADFSGSLAPVKWMAHEPPALEVRRGKAKSARIVVPVDLESGANFGTLFIPVERVRAGESGAVSEIRARFRRFHEGPFTRDVAEGDPPPIRPLARAGEVIAVFRGFQRVREGAALELLLYPTHATLGGRIRLFARCTDGGTHGSEAATAARTPPDGWYVDTTVPSTQRSPPTWLRFPELADCSVQNLELDVQYACSGQRCQPLRLVISRAALREQPWPREDGP